jgi:hypothetical protein
MTNQSAGIHLLRGLYNIAASRPHGWHLGANDNTWGGWLALCVYLILCALCWLEVSKQLRLSREVRQGLPPLFWVLLSVGVTGLGINKQLDFQTLFMEAGRRIAISEGLIAYRRFLETSFFAIVFITGIFMAAVLWKLARRLTKAERQVLVGTALLFGFVLLRVAKIEHVGGALIAGITHRSLLATELAATGFLSIAVWRNDRQPEKTVRRRQD